MSTHDSEEPPRGEGRGETARPAHRRLFKILRSAELAEFRERGTFPGSPDDLRDGFIHLCTEPQLEGTIAKHFSGRQALSLQELSPETLGEELVFEPSRGGALFPHLYRALLWSDVLSCEERQTFPPD